MLTVNGEAANSSNAPTSSRQAWFHQYVERCETGVVSPPSEGIRYVCPCCRYLTLSERGGYDICSLCGWEDDGQDDPHADEKWGGPNGRYSLSEARSNFAKNLTKYDTMKPSTRIGGHDNQREFEAKRAMIAAFDAMPLAADDRLNELWDAVRRADEILQSELSRKIREYERQHQASSS